MPVSTSMLLLLLLLLLFLSPSITGIKAFQCLSRNLRPSLPDQDGWGIQSHRLSGYWSLALSSVQPAVVGLPNPRHVSQSTTPSPSHVFSFYLFWGVIQHIGSCQRTSRMLVGHVSSPRCLFRASATSFSCFHTYSANVWAYSFSWYSFHREFKFPVATAGIFSRQHGYWRERYLWTNEEWGNPLREIIHRIGLKEWWFCLTQQSPPPSTPCLENNNCWLFNCWGW